ncbi:MAG: hypothetical protein KC416_01985 [Myxococcales bacterium]|nr:hypothetical protein [Myxococcales bacterium]
MRARRPLRHNTCAFRIALLILLLGGCGGASTVPQLPVEVDVPAPPEELALLVPDAAKVFHLWPRSLCGEPALRGLVDVVISPDARRRLEARYGIDPCDVDEALVAFSGEARLLFLRGSWKAADAVRSAKYHMEVRTRSDRPWVRRGGFIGNVPREWVALDDHTLIVADGDPKVLATVLERIRQGSFRTEGPTTGSTGSLVVAPRPGALRLVAGRTSGPVAFDEITDAALLFARTTGFSFAIDHGDPSLVFELTAHGEFPAGAEENLRALALSILRGPMGRALGLSDLGDRLAIHAVPSGYRLRFEAPLAPVVSGLHRLFRAEIGEIAPASPSD